METESDCNGPGPWSTASSGEAGSAVSAEVAAAAGRMTCGAGREDGPGGDATETGAPGMMEVRQSRPPAVAPVGVNGGVQPKPVRGSHGMRWVGPAPQQSEAGCCAGRRGIALWGVATPTGRASDPPAGGHSGVGGPRATAASTTGALAAAPGVAEVGAEEARSDLAAAAPGALHVDGSWGGRPGTSTPTPSGPAAASVVQAATSGGTAAADAAARAVAACSAVSPGCAAVHMACGARSIHAAAVGGGTVLCAACRAQAPGGIACTPPGGVAVAAAAVKALVGGVAAAAASAQLGTTSRAPARLPLESRAGPPTPAGRAKLSGGNRSCRQIVN